MEAFPLVAPGRILTVVPLIVKARAITVTIFVPAALVYVEELAASGM